VAGFFVTMRLFLPWGRVYSAGKRPLFLLREGGHCWCPDQKCHSPAWRM